MFIFLAAQESGTVIPHPFLRLFSSFCLPSYVFSFYPSTHPPIHPSHPLIWHVSTRRCEVTRVLICLEPAALLDTQHPDT